MYYDSNLLSEIALNLGFNVYRFKLQIRKFLSLYNILFQLLSVFPIIGTLLFSKSSLTSKFEKLISNKSFHQRTKDKLHTSKNSAGNQGGPLTTKGSGKQQGGAYSAANKSLKCDISGKN